MKRLKKSKNISFGPVIVTSGDVERLVGDIPEDIKYIITTDDMEYSDISEFKGHCRRTSGIKIHSERYIFSINLRHNYTDIDIYDVDGIKSSAIEAMIERIKAMERRPKILFSSTKFPIFSGVINLLYYYLSKDLMNNALIRDIIGFTGSTILLVWMIYVLYINMRKHSMFLLEGVESKIAKKIDLKIAIAAALASAIVSGMISPITTKIIEKYIGSMGSKETSSDLRERPRDK